MNNNAEIWDIFELGSFALLSSETNEVIYKYGDYGNFPHDEFHCVLTMETSLYVFTKRKTGFNSPIKMCDLEIKDGIFYLYDVDGEIIYETNKTIGLDIKALRQSILLYLDQFSIRRESDYIVHFNGSRTNFEKFKENIREEQRTFFNPTPKFDKIDQTKMTNYFLETLNNTASRSDLKKSYRALMKEYHPDVAIHNGISKEKALFCSKSINSIYLSLMKKY